MTEKSELETFAEAIETHGIQLEPMRFGTDERDYSSIVFETLCDIFAYETVNMTGDRVTGG
jgi:hypothetical protein